MTDERRRERDETNRCLAHVARMDRRNSPPVIRGDRRERWTRIARMVGHLDSIDKDDLRAELEESKRERMELEELRADVTATLTKLKELADADWCDCFGRTQAFDAAWELLDPSMQDYLKASEAWKRVSR